MSAAHGIKPEQRTGLEHFKEALKEVSDEEGSTVHYSAGGSDPLPHHNPDNIGTRSEELKGRDLFVAPSADGKHADIVERIDLDSSAILPDLKTGMGGHAGPTVDDHLKFHQA
eukprot:jgi/Chrzof1/11568/Cz06g00160.t1